MNIFVVGAGPAGLITAVCFANKKNTVYIYDKDKSKLEKIKAGKTPFYEKDLGSELGKTEENIKPVFEMGRGFRNAEIIFICVGTPCRSNNKIDLSQIHSACDELADLIRNSTARKIITIRSTVVPGTVTELVGRIEEKSGKKYPEEFGVVSNPEFLRQGNAIEDFLYNNKVIIGSDNSRDADKLKEIYSCFERPIHAMSSKSAEMAKYMNNCFSTTKISFINEMGLIAKEQGIDINEISEALDMRLGQGNFPLKAGCGFGGGYLEKDLKAFIEVSKEYGIEPRMLSTALKINEQLPVLMINILRKKLGKLEGKKIGMLGLAFKKGTDGIRNSRSGQIIDKLESENASIFVYDPKVVDTGLEHAENAQKLIDESDAIVIVSDWDEFSELDYGDKIVIDGRNVVPKEKRGKNYEGICWP